MLVKKRSMSKSNYLESQFINHVFGGTTFTKPTQWWLALYGADPGEALTNTTPRVTSLVQITGWTLSQNQASNTNQIQFPPVPTGQVWTVSHFAIFTAETSGEPLYLGAFRLTKTLEEGDIFIIAAGQLVIRED